VKEEQKVFLKFADPIAYFNHGKMKYERGDYQGAIDDFSQSIYMNPNYAESYNGRGLARFALGNKKEAIADYDTAIHLKPDYVEAYHNRANAKYSLGYLRGAIADLQQAAELLRQQGNRGEHQRLLNKIESYCQTIDTPEKLKWDRHIENWFTDQNYQRKVATDFAFRNQVIPGYENHSAVSPEPVTPGEPIYYDLRLALTISSKEKKVRLFKGGVLAGIGAVLIWFGGVNLIRWGGGLGVASGGFVVLNTLVSTVDDTEKARQEREKARQERARLAMYEHKKKEEEKEINRRIQKHSLEIDKEINRRLLSFSGIPVHILTDPNCVNSLSYADQICAKIVLKQIIQQQQTEANQAEEDDDSALGNLILFLIALGLIGIWK
jgi:tetratricopeptide (TPR) repeat protein